MRDRIRPKFCADHQALFSPNILDFWPRVLGYRWVGRGRRLWEILIRLKLYWNRSIIDNSLMRIVLPKKNSPIGEFPSCVGKRPTFAAFLLPLQGSKWWFPFCALRYPPILEGIGFEKLSSYSPCWVKYGCCFGPRNRTHKRDRKSAPQHVRRIIHPTRGNDLLERVLQKSHGIFWRESRLKITQICAKFRIFVILAFCTYG